MDKSSQPLQGEFVLGKQKPEKTLDIKNSKKGIDSTDPPFSHSGDARKNPHFYSSLSYFPQGITFEDQEANEEIILLIRRDFITNIPWVAMSFSLIIAPILFSFFSDTLFPFIQISPTTHFLLLLFYYLLVAGFILVEFTLWYFNILLVTNMRVIDVDIDGILYKNVAQTKLDLIQDVSYTQIGAIRSLFNYGDILVQTAGSLGNFECTKAPEPARVIKIIGDLIGK
ncbi:MAG: hypothetical protein COX79_05435 [Candidatus Levybacteria bacterium CG_4_10_14_0_2_um_filter_36_16]|nr:MAG: hypothetical protein AUK12_04630 [Candidatus Levybacteria bacterium CG2_30_37_29]PIZ96332.1 MAG: hypothetical protein COX79_05435 [Candidatus Levybacteria bacterium CG_4_10_14_0_2_um_filter_36_16]